MLCCDDVFKRTLDKFREDDNITVKQRRNKKFECQDYG